MENLRDKESKPESLTSFFKRDSDGVFFLDYLEMPCLRIAANNDDDPEGYRNFTHLNYPLRDIGIRLQIIREQIQELVKSQHSNDLKIAAKYRWLIQYFNQTLKTKEALLLEEVKIPNLTAG